MTGSRDDLREALAMVRALEVIDALPPAYKPSDDTPLRGSLPGVWPTIGDLREFVDQVSALQAEVERREHRETVLRADLQNVVSAGVTRVRQVQADAAASAAIAADEIASLRAEVERLQKVEGEREVRHAG